MNNLASRLRNHAAAPVWPIALGVIAIVLSYAVPNILIKQDEKNKSRIELVNDTSRTWLQLMGGFGIFLSVYLGWRNYLTAAQKESREVTGFAEARFRMAVELLAREELVPNIAGIRLLQRLMRDSPTDCWTAANVVVSHIRKRTTISGWASPTTYATAHSRSVALDIQAAFDVLRRRPISAEEAEGNRLDLSNIIVGNAEVNKANFAHVLLNAAQCQGAQLREANFTRAFMHGANFDFAHLEAARFIEVDAVEVSLCDSLCNDAAFVGTPAAKAQLQGARFSNVNLTRATFEHAHLRGADFSLAHGEGARFTHVDATDAVLTGCDLGGALFDNCCLDGVKFTDANLSECYMSDNTSVRGAIFERVDFSNAVLNRVDFSQAIVSEIVLDDAKTEMTQWPSAM